MVILDEPNDSLTASNKSAQQVFIVKCVQHLILIFPGKFLAVTAFLQNVQVPNEQVGLLLAETDQKIVEKKIKVTLISMILL